MIREERRIPEMMELSMPAASRSPRSGVCRLLRHVHFDGDAYGSEYSAELDGHNVEHIEHDLKIHRRTAL